MERRSRPQGLTLAYVIGTYPRLTTTFIDREVAALRRRGVRVAIVSLRRPDGPLSRDQSTDGVVYALPAAPLGLLRSHIKYLMTRPRAYLGTLAHLVSAKHRTHRLRARTIGHWILAVHVAGLVAGCGRVDHVHAHFVDRAATVALVASRVLGVPYSATAHANDIYVDPVLLDEKIAGAKFVATCTGANAQYLARVVSLPARIRRIHHGLDVGAYSVPQRTQKELPTLLAVGQLKEKKGFLYLVEACSILTSGGRRFRCEIVGEGPQRPQLEAAIASAGLEDTVVLRGALTHDALKVAYAAANVFVLPCVVGSDGDRDGIPNVILEAMASGLPVVSTDHSGIPEAVAHGRSGLLVPPGEASALATALGKLLDDDDMRRSLGAAGRRLVADSFDLETNVGLLLAEISP